MMSSKYTVSDSFSWRKKPSAVVNIFACCGDKLRHTLNQEQVIWMYTIAHVDFLSFFCGSISELYIPNGRVKLP